MANVSQLSFFQELQARGLVKQTTDPELEKRLSEGSLTLYCGFDPTSDSLHVGSLLPLLTLRRFQMAGHRIIAVAGGATGMIGDPSGKSQERSLLNEDQLNRNVAGITQVIQRFLKLDGDRPALVLNNADWFRNLSYIEFLRDIGKHFTVNHMVAKESVRARLEDREHGISYTEFSYMLLQAYDFLHLHQNKNCTLQIGGSDQWGNITAGIELIRRKGLNDRPAYGLTHPLVMKADGTKFGKTESGTVWLDAKRTSPYEFYQFLIQTSDADVVTYLRYFTFLSLEEIDRLTESVTQAPERREAQRALARELTRLVHGEEELKRVEGATQALFGGGGGSGGDLSNLDEKSLLELFSEAPSTEKPMDLLKSGWTLVDAVAETKLCGSKGAARKDITAGGIYLNNERVSDVQAKLDPSHLLAGKFILLRKGKKTYHLLVFK